MTATEMLQKALGALAEGRLDEARAGCEQVLGMEPDNAVALHWAAVIAYQQGAEPDAVLGQIERAIALSDAEAVFHNSRGALLYALGRDLEAAESFHNAVKLDDSDGPVWNNLGNALLRLNRVEVHDFVEQAAQGDEVGRTQRHGGCGLSLRS